MNYVRSSTAVFLFIAAVTTIGCGSKQDKTGAPAAAPQGKPGATAVAPQGKPGATAVAPQGKPGATAIAPQDQSDARAAAAHVHAQMKAGEFAAIYKESAPEFKEIGNESQFVSAMQQTRQKTGALKSVKEVGYEVGPKNRQMLMFSVKYDNILSDQRLTFARSGTGKMELCGFNQKDAVKK